MSKTYSILTSLQKQWQRRQLFQLLLQAAAITLVVTLLLYKILGISFLIAIPVFAGVFAVLKWTTQTITSQRIARHLNSTFPILEESCELLIKPESSLTLLERLQVSRLEKRLTEILSSALLPFRWKTPLIWLTGSLLLAGFIWWLPLAFPDSTPLPKTAYPSIIQRTSLASLPEITALNIRVQPPSYTGKAVFFQQNPHVQADAGAILSWNIQLSHPADSVYVVLNDKQVIRCTPLKNQTNTYSASFTLVENGFYQIIINGKTSDYYTLEAIPDKPPVITVSSPEPYTEILFGQSLQRQVKMTITDDHGLRNAYMVATVAKGTGEAVKFREEKLPLPVSFKPFQKQADVQKNLDLSQFTMAPGDELYFYVEALDNHGLSGRTDMYFIALEDTANISTVADLSMGINPVPEYFRSQRQIIIDTEKLIKQRSDISQAEFTSQSNNIGVDQKILRLRYGKFLGEEFESQIGAVAGQEEMEKEGIEVEQHFAGDGHDHSKDGLESYMHLHDQSEEATFFEPALKAQLKAALAQMWEAELRLRTSRPKEALPFEYKALQLLKEVQQKSRAYVSKTGYEPPPIKPAELRLTGELDKIQQPSVKEERENALVYPNIRQSLAVLEHVKNGRKPDKQQIAILEKAGSEMSAAAIEQPGKYLQVLSALKQLTGELRNPASAICHACITTVEKAFWQLLPPAQKTPQVPETAPGKLADSYFRYLQTATH
ncbi:DUF4175 domain-containing protein [Rhodocytophaga rosea]|uniref:DUF4175 domain-containing protein n=1 Tax=Rhodocytophaga rosea TaxID=2704465 RepID=A0A6C0GH88_9BACT|nr:DUF4175 family protein [Rhodocytophaga rosea]QHT67255.1 DUF4175 domain-containing protein [Rhodocytophaga rosea]